MPKWLIVIVLPICIFLGFFVVLVKEIGMAFRRAWLEAMFEIEAAQRYWRS
jgi:hypothetical protein